MSPVAEERDVFRASFDSFVASLPADGPTWLRTLRTAAMQRFAERGFPAPNDEAWRHTSVAPLARTVFRRAEDQTLDGAVTHVLGDARLSENVAAEAILVNGRLAPALSRGSLVRGMREALGESPRSLEAVLGRTDGAAVTSFADLNTAFLDDGACLFIPAGTRIEGVVHVLHVSTRPADGPTVSHPRVLIVAGPGSEVRVVETYAGPDGPVYWTNAVTEIILEDGAVVDHVKVQQEGLAAYHVATIAARLGRDARLSAHAITRGGALSRDDVSVTFAGQGGECVLNGLLLGSGAQHLDAHTRVDHARPHTTSRELYKGVFDGKARGVFDGRVVVRKDAQKTDAQQTNKNLLLSREALVHSTPALEILADDVKCKHGSTTGQLDPTSLFYLRSRGIGETEAGSLLTFAFASDVVQKIPVAEVRARVEERLQSQLGTEARA